MKNYSVEELPRDTQPKQDGSEFYRELYLKAAQYREMYLKVRDELAALQQEVTKATPYSSRENYYQSLALAAENAREDARVKTVVLRREKYDVALPILEDFSGRVVVAGVPWVGLTDAERNTIADAAAADDWHDFQVIETTEAKLREKNSAA